MRVRIRGEGKKRRRETSINISRLRKMMLKKMMDMIISVVDAR